ncbi:GATA zinc finger domain-containing protein 7-like isoform X4 [Pieris napi]|uniref:GATA zinc finger domain-containing protein 7-like isoform X4 n=1 Tax=Pieris napi TaxID=78633 RepID=UPI001FBC09BA|nr:GATA zinc finger domain-containing protein 7-like isoform X4 [Pieris napi]
MAPGNKDRHPSHTGTIPKTKVRNNCNVPQEAVTPTRRDMASNLVSTALDWVPVSEYNPRSSNSNQSRKQTNNTSDQDFTDLDNSVAFESGFGRFVPVRPQPRALPLTVQNREHHSGDRDNLNDDASSSGSHSLHPYAHQMQNGLIPHSNHAAAAVMIVNPTTPNTVAGNMPQTFTAQNQNRKNFARNLNSNRHNFEGNNNSNNNTASNSNSRSSTKAVNMMNNMYDQGQGSFNNINENNHVNRESARALGEAIVAVCPDAASVERRLGQIREYIRVTSSLVDTMRNSEDEQDVVVRPVSVQSNGSAYSENELWQNEIKNKMEMSQMRLSALKQQQKMLIKYQEEAKQQLEELNKQSQEMHHPSTSHENFSNPQNVNANYTNSNRMYATNQIGVATTLPQDVFSNETRSNHSQHQDDRFSIRDGNIASSEEAGHRSDAEEDAEGVLQERGRMLHRRLRDLQLKKQHMENLVTEFQKLQMAASMGVAHNTYSSSGEDSGEDEPSRKCNKSGVNMKNEDPFKLMEIKAIKTALQKTKDLMRSVETFEADHLSGTTEDTFHMPSHSNNIHDNKSESGSVGGWSGEGSVCRVLNSLPHRHKFTNEHSGQNHSQRTQNHIQNRQMQPQQSHEANINSLQELAQELRMETEKIMGERARIKDLVTNKVAEANRKPKKVNEEVSVSCPGPAERRQMQLRALLAEKQRELELLLNKEVMNASSESPQVKADSRAVSVANQSYSEPEEAESSEHIQIDSQNSRETENFRGGGDSALGSRSNTAPSQHASAYCSDTDSASRGKSNQRNRQRRRTQDRLEGNEHLPQNNCVNNSRHEPRPEPNNMTPPASQHVDNATNMPYPHMPPPCWNSKSNQDMRANQFTQNSHSQTMERLLGTPQMTYPPSMPFNMMMPFGGVMCGCACGCSCSTWGAWCWQQILMQQRDIHHMRQQINHLEERWRAETASHTLNNQVPPGNRANNYWDNFRSYSRQNLLSTNSKTNADGPSSTNPPLERSHNSLRRGSAQASPCATPKRNTNDPRAEEQMRNSQANVAYERSLSFSSAPDVLNLNQNEDAPVPRNQNDSAANINRQEAANRNLNITNPIPEIIQSHSNLNKKKSSAKLPSKNSANRRNYNVLDFSQTSNINIASTSEANTTSQEIATSRLFDILRESIYSEVTTLIGVNESHPDFLIQLFKELTHISSDRLRQRVLQAIRQISQYNAAIENQNDSTQEEYSMEAVTTTSTDHDNYCDVQNGLPQIDNRILRFLVVKSEDIFTPELLEAFANIVINNANDNRHAKKLLESLLKYEGMRVCDVSTDIIENLPAMIGVEEDNHHSEISEPNLQDVAGSLSLFGSSDTQMHQINGCPYIWPGHVHMDMDSTDTNNSQEGKSDLITCSEMLNGDLAEADQTCRSDVSENAGNRQDGDGGNAEALPDVVDTEEVTPTEAEAEWLGLDRVPTRLHMEDKSEKQKGDINKSY